MKYCPEIPNKTEYRFLKFLINHAVTNPQDIAEMFNKHFSEIGLMLSLIHPEGTKSFDSYLQLSSSDYEFLKIENNTVYRLLSSVPERKAAGIDGISGKL